jgi:cytochrome c oxidase subunit 2
MNASLSLPEASTHAVTVDHIFYLLLVLSGATVVLVFGLILLFAVRYRRGSAAKRGPMPELLSHEFEIGWTLATLLTFAFLF